METNKLVAGIVAAAISIIVLAGVLMPVLNDVTTTHNTFTNEGIVYAEKLTSASAHEFEWKYTAPTIIKIDDHDFDMSTLLSEYSGITVMFSDDWMVRYQKDSSSILLIKVNEAATTVDTASVSNEKDFTVSISSGAATITVGITEYDYSVQSDGMIMTSDDKAEYIVKNSTDSAYVLDTSMIYGAGRTGRPFGAGTALSTLGKGSIKDGMTIEISPSSYFVESSAMNYTAVSGYNSLYKLTDFSFLLNNGSDQTTTIIYNQIFVPHTVTAEKAQHLSDPGIVILNVIPIIILVAVLLAVVAIFIMRRE